MNQMAPAPGQARRSLGTSWVDPLAGAAADGFASAPKLRANENPRRCGECNFNQLEFMRLRNMTSCRPASTAEMAMTDEQGIQARRPVAPRVRVRPRPPQRGARRAATTARRARRPPRRIHRMPQAAAGRPTRPRELLAATYRCVLAGQADVAGLISAGELSPSTPAQPRSPRSQGDSRSTSSGTTATQRARPDNVPLPDISTLQPLRNCHGLSQLAQTLRRLAQPVRR